MGSCYSSWRYIHVREYCSTLRIAVYRYRNIFSYIQNNNAAVGNYCGDTFFSEGFSGVEWVGLFLSLSVPLLLVTHTEKSRQKNLFRGLRLLLSASLIAAVSVGAIKLGLDQTDNVLLFSLQVDLMLGIAGLITLFLQSKKFGLRSRISNSFRALFLVIVIVSGIFQFTNFVLLTFALSIGSLGIVYTINSLYILVPIILSIIYYNEHWNYRKVTAIVLSIAALAFLK
jgi:drug/metabolite transporter (DMT)-like permease